MSKQSNKEGSRKSHGTKDIQILQFANLKGVGREEVKSSPVNNVK